MKTTATRQARWKSVPAFKLRVSMSGLSMFAALSMPLALSCFNVAEATENIGVYRDGGWLFDDRNDGWNGLNNSGRVPEGILLHFGLSGDHPLLGDIDGDGRDEVLTYRRGWWYSDLENNGFQKNSGAARNLETGENYPLQFGLPTDIPVVGNIRGAAQSRDEITVFRPSNGMWIIDDLNDGYQSERYAFQFGLKGDVPLLADPLGDGRDRPVVFRTSPAGRGMFFIDWEQDGYTGEGVSFYRGQRGDKVVAGDVNGDGRDEFGLFRDGNWHFFNHVGAHVQTVENFGLASDIPVIGRALTRSNMETSSGIRGLSCLHCGHPNAKSSAMSIANAIGAANLERPAISFLIDNHFIDKRRGLDLTLFRNLIDRIGGKYPHVELYLLNGPGQRRWASNGQNQLSDGFGTTMSPDSFNKLIEQNDPATIKTIRKHFRRAEQICDIVLRKGGQCLISPSLEDNFSSAAVAVLAAHFESWRAGRPYWFIRNRNLSSSQAHVPSGWVSEVHTRNVSKIQRTAANIVSTDDGQAFKGYCALKTVADEATRQGKVFFAWNKDTQGIASAGQLDNPNARIYKSLSSQDATNAILLLQDRCD